MKLAVVIVNYNSTDYLQRCLQSVFEQTLRTELAVTVVDNASDDQDFRILQETFPDVQFILNQQNLGFSKGCNQGLRAQSADAYLLLNPDCIVHRAALDESAAFLRERPDVGIVGCRVTNSDGTLQRACRRRIPRPSMAFYRFAGLSRLFPNSPRFGAYNLAYREEDAVQEVEAVSGSFLMFRRDLLETVGYLDETFFMYGEDLDFCYRASQAGWKIYYFPGAQVTHVKQASSSQRPRESNFHFYDAMRLFYRKHFYAAAGPVEHVLVLGGIRILYLGSRLRRALGFRQVGSKG